MVANSIQMPMDVISIDPPRHLLNHSMPKSNYSGLIGELSPCLISSYSGLKNCSLETHTPPQFLVSRLLPSSFCLSLRPGWKGPKGAAGTEAKRTPAQPEKAA
jgi:hypothetical protein